MTTPQPSRFRLMFRVLAGLLVIVALPFFVLGVQEPHPNWRFIIALAGFILLFGYVAANGKAPFCSR